MASSFRQNMRTYTAAATIQPFTAVKFTTGVTAGTRSITTCGAGDPACGISQNAEAILAGFPVEVAMPGGGGKWRAGATWADMGQILLKSDAAGKAVKAADGDNVVAQGDAPAATNDIFEVYVIPSKAGSAQA